MPKRDPKKGRPAMAIQEEPLISPAMKTKMQREAGERQVKLYLKASQGEPGAEAEFRKVYGIPSRQYPHKYVPKTQSGNVLKDLPPELIKSTTGQRVKSEIDFPRTDMRNKNFVNPLTTYLAPHITNPELKKAMDKIQLAPIEMVLPIPGLEVMGKIPSAFKAVKNLTKSASRSFPVKSITSSVNNVGKKQIDIDFADMVRSLREERQRIKDVYHFHGKPYKLDKKQTIETIEADKYISDWYNDKATIKKFKSYGGDEKSLKKLQDNLVQESYVESGGGPDLSAGFLSDEGVSFAWDPPYESLRTPEHIKRVKSTLVHEKTHQAKIIGDTREESLLPKLWDDIDKLTGYSKKYTIANKGEIGMYLDHPTEVYSRIIELKHKAGLKPNENFTKELLEKVGEVVRNSDGKKIIQYSGSMPPGYSKNEKAWLNLINKTPMIIPTAAVIGTGAAKRALNKDDFATGGMIPKRNRKYQDGGEKGEKPLYDSLDHKQSYYLHDDITRLFNDWNYYKKFQEAGWPIELVSEAIKRNQDKWQRFDKDPMRFEENMIGHRMDKFVPDSLSKFVENKDLESLLRYGHSVVQESKPTDMRQKIEGMKSGGMKKAKGKYMIGGKKGYNTGGATAEQIAALLAKQSEEQKQATKLSGITDAATMGADMIAGQLAQSAQADLADLDYRVDPEASMRKANRKNIAGSMLSTTAKGAAAGTKIGGPGIGTLIGAGAGLVFSGAEALFGKGQRDKEIKEAKNQRAGVLSNLYAGAMESQSFKKGGKKGGKVKGQGGPKEDNIEMKVPDGSFIVPAENAEEAMEIGMAYLDWNEETIAERNMGGSKINISNGEVVFAPEEVEMLKMYGVDLDALAPNAPPERQMEQEPGMEQMLGMGEMEQEIPAFVDGGGKNSLTKQEKREEREARKKWMAENNMLTTGQKLARFAPEIVGALQSSAGLVGLATAKKMPDPVVSLELKKILSETAKLKEQGLDPRTKNIALQEIEKNRRSAMNAIITRGGTTSDIMSGMRDITSGTLSSVEKIIDADEAIRKGNRTAYLDALMKIGTRKDAIQDQKGQRIKDRSDAYGDLFSAGLENIAGSRRFRGLKDIYKEESDKPGFTFPG